LRFKRLRDLTCPEVPLCEQREYVLPPYGLGYKDPHYQYKLAQNWMRAYHLTRTFSGRSIRNQIVSLPQGLQSDFAAAENRKLIVVPEQADVVRRIYARYLKCKNLRDLTFELNREGITAERG